MGKAALKELKTKLYKGHETVVCFTLLLNATFESQLFFLNELSGDQGCIERKIL